MLLRLEDFIDSLTGPVGFLSLLFIIGLLITVVILLRRLSQWATNRNIPVLVQLLALMGFIGLALILSKSTGD